MREFQDVVERIVRPRAVVNADGQILSANRALCEQTGYAAEVLCEMRLRDLADLEHCDRDEAEFAKLFELGVGYTVEKRWTRADGYAQTRLWAHAPVDSEELGRVAVVEWFPISGTLRANLAEQEIALRAEQLRRAEHLQVIGRMAGAVAHDFNNLLSVILGYAELLRTQLDDEGHRAHLDLIHTAGQRSAELTRKLLAMERWSTPEPRPIELSALLEGALRTLKRLVPKHVEVVAHLHGVQGKVFVDPIYAEVALLELASNATRAMPSGGRITIEAEAVHLDDAHDRTLLGLRPGRYLQISFSDTGAGVSRDAIQRLLLVCRGEESPSDPLSADPLGAVRRFVARNGGAVWPYSEPGLGTTVKLYLPAVSDLASEAPPPSELSTEGSETVLVVEDAADLRSLFATALAAKGYTVLSAHDGLDALARAQAYEGEIDLLITDVVMPRLSGPDLVRQLGPRHRSAKVIFASGFTREVLAARAGGEQIGERFLSKPVTPGTLLRKVREVLDS